MTYGTSGSMPIGYQGNLWPTGAPTCDDYVWTSTSKIAATSAIQGWHQSSCVAMVCRRRDVRKFSKTLVEN